MSKKQLFDEFERTNSINNKTSIIIADNTDSKPDEESRARFKAALFDKLAKQFKQGATPSAVKSGMMVTANSTTASGDDLKAISSGTLAERFGKVILFSPPAYEQLLPALLQDEAKRIDPSATVIIPPEDLKKMVDGINGEKGLREWAKRTITPAFKSDLRSCIERASPSPVIVIRLHDGAMIVSNYDDIFREVISQGVPCSKRNKLSVKGIK